MKKLIILAATCFLFAGCAKVDTTPDSQQNNVAKIAPDPQLQIQPFSG
ncbi:MAG: hypothetical protein IPI66_03455 [Chitinophagaceae bacterium]|nr:hypothetical protein [Chitinophagaceae bacterium]